MTKTPNMKTIPVADFYGSDYVDYASYDNLRKIASVVDGQKNAARKVLHTVLEKNVRGKKIKVSQLASKVAEYTEYLHGDVSGVIVTMGQDFPGTNNLPLLQRSGNFGTRFHNEASASRYIHSYGKDVFFELFKKDDINFGTRFHNEASASRYIHSYGKDVFFELFKKDDIDILKQQYFEGQRIEPMFFVPSLPMILINGSDGVSSGFAQKILPRSPEKIKQYLTHRLQGKGSYYKFEPHFNGFNGVIEQGDNPSQWKIKGVINRKSINKVEILEIPVGYELKGYLKVLDTLEEKKVIQSYRDKSEDDIFKFEVSIASKDLKNWSDEELLQKLKLVKTVTENYTVIDENNKIQVYNSPKEIMDKYIEVKMEYMKRRKENNLARLQESILFDQSKYKFIEMIVNDELIVNKRKKSDIEKDLHKVLDILDRNGSYDYLLNMSISTLTSERMKQLENNIKDNQKRLKELNQKTLEKLWLEDLS
ncbi:DNA topoisomerase II [Vibrio phage phiKT1024]|nr:DNA topoisomerase II [Vibrio phage phiKT1024]